jgi:hypothetical protein
VTLIELNKRHGHRLAYRCKSPSKARDLRGEGDATAAAGGTRGFDAGDRRRELGAPFDRELNRPLLRDKSALSQLSANGRDDRNGQIHCAGKYTYRYGLEPR